MVETVPLRNHISGIVPTSTGCARCSECIGRTHHWQPNWDWQPDSDPEELPSHVCKHCSATGDYCPNCDGEGVVNQDFENEYDLGDTCGRCHGEGVILREGITRRIEEAPDAD